MRVEGRSDVHRHRKQSAVGFSSLLAGLASEGCSRVLARRQNTAAGRDDRECDLRFFRLFLRGAGAGPRSAVNVGFTTAHAGIPSAPLTSETRSCHINGADCTLRHHRSSIVRTPSTDRAGAIAPDWRLPRSREVTERRHVIAPSRKRNGRESPPGQRVVSVSRPEPLRLRHPALPSPLGLRPWPLDLRLQVSAGAGAGSLSERRLNHAA
jgi:hypothetical protein